MTQAGEFRARFTFSRLGTADGDGGNVTGGPFAPQFTVWAKAQPLNGGEEVMAGRLASQRLVLLTVRSSCESRAITTEWAARDARTGEAFNIREVKDPDMMRHVIEILCQSGVAGGGLPGEQS